jgi:hypothetical protein
MNANALPNTFMGSTTLNGEDLTILKAHVKAEIERRHSMPPFDQREKTGRFDPFERADAWDFAATSSRQVRGPVAKQQLYRVKILRVLRQVAVEVALELGPARQR